jgi:hypothetical protein
LQLMAMIGRKVLIDILFQADRAHGCPLWSPVFPTGWFG